MKVYRRCGRSRDPKDPAGAELRGGRWNSPGVAVLYCASSLSLACLEQLVHIRNPANFPLHHYAEVDIPDELVTKWGSRFSRIDPLRIRHPGIACAIPRARRRMGKR